MSDGEEICKRYFYGWRSLSIPIDTQNTAAPMIEKSGIVRHHPDMLNDSRAIDVHKRNGLMCLGGKERVFLPFSRLSRTEVIGVARKRGLCRRHPLTAGGIF